MTEQQPDTMGMANFGVPSDGDGLSDGRYAEAIALYVEASRPHDDYAYTCPSCSWRTKDVRYEQHACPGEPAEPALSDPGSSA